MMMFNRFLVMMVVFFNCACALAKSCEFKETSINDFAGGNEIELIQSGLITNPSNHSLYPYLDEAIAQRKGMWGCKGNILLFQSVAKRKGVPDGNILYSLALNESKMNGYPHPWTINVFGKGYYFNTRAEAYTAAKWLLSKNVTSFDVGIMQVNWKYHKDKFKSLWDAFQPSTNIEVGSDILLENYQITGSWSKAVKWYHNRTNISRGNVYFARFIKHFESMSEQQS